jgi:DNA-binding PadR family transcriptional regulator
MQPAKAIGVLVEDRAAELEGNVPSDLTDNEGSLLAIILRRQPITTYQIVKMYERSPASSFNESKGSVYPLVERLIRRGFVGTEASAQGKRTAQLLSCTDAGREAVRAWVLTIRPSHILLDDPLRGKVASFDLLTQEERLRWIVDMKEMVEAKMIEVEEYHKIYTLPFDPMIKANGMGSLKQRMEWLDEILRFIVRN